MKVTTTNTAAYLHTLMGADNMKILWDATKGQPLKSVIIYNKDTTNKLYVEIGAAAAVATGFPIDPGKSFTFRVDQLSLVSIIAETASIDTRISACI